MLRALLSAVGAGVGPLDGEFGVPPGPIRRVRGANSARRAGVRLRAMTTSEPIPCPEPAQTEAEITPLAAIKDPAERAAVARMRGLYHLADPVRYLPDVAPTRVPRHVAIIMDGNGRWAQKRGLARMAGHKAGSRLIRSTLEECRRLGVEVLTLYSFSLENWKRPAEEVNFLMDLYLAYMDMERAHLVDTNCRFVQIGRREGLPQFALDALDRTVEATKNCTGTTLCLAVNYGSRAEITDAVRSIARDVKAGRVSPDAVDERTIQSRLYTAGLPDPDLLIRTAGEMRVSNYLLWQISYAELHVIPTLWPDFTNEDLREAIRSYARRDRRFGGLGDTGGT